MRFKIGEVVVGADGDLYTIKNIVENDSHPCLVLNHRSELSYWVKESYLSPTYGFQSPLWKVLNGEDYDE